MDSLDSVEAVMLLEEVLEIEIPDGEAERFGSLREVVNYLERCLSSQRPGKQAAAVIKRLANSQNNPQLAEGLDDQWRREQIAAVVREIFRSHDLDDWSDPSDPDASVRSPLNPKPYPRSGAARVFPEQEQQRGHCRAVRRQSARPCQLLQNPLITHRGGFECNR
jgi:hypothetical protein